MRTSLAIILVFMLSGCASSLRPRAEIERVSDNRYIFSSNVDQFEAEIGDVKYSSKKTGLFSEVLKLIKEKEPDPSSEELPWVDFNFYEIVLSSVEQTTFDEIFYDKESVMIGLKSLEGWLERIDISETDKIEIERDFLQRAVEKQR